MGTKLDNRSLTEAQMALLLELRPRGHTYPEILRRLEKEMEEGGETLTPFATAHMLSRLYRQELTRRAASLGAVIPEKRIEMIMTQDAVIKEAWELHRKKPDYKNLKVVLEAANMQSRMLGLHIDPKTIDATSGAEGGTKTTWIPPKKVAG